MRRSSRRTTPVFARRPDRRRRRADDGGRASVPGGARGPVRATTSRQIVLPFPSQEVDPYRGLTPHLEVASARARALFGLATRHRAAGRRVGARAAAAPVSDPERLAAAGLTLTAGLEIAPQDLGEPSGARRVHARGSGRRARRVLRARRGRRLLSRRSSRSRFVSSSSATSSTPSAGTTPPRSARRLAIDRVVVSPQRELLPDAGSAGRSGGARSVRDDRRLRPPRGRDRRDRLEIDDVVERGQGARAAVAQRLRPTCRTAAARSRRYEADRRSNGAEVDAWLRSAPSGEPARRSTTPRPADAHRRGAGARATTAASATGPTRSRGRANAATPSCSWPRRPAAPSGRRDPGRLRHPRAPDWQARRPGAAPPCSSTTGQLSRASTCRPRTSLLFAETDLFEEERRVHERRRSATHARSSRISAI